MSDDEQRLESLDGMQRSNFMLHYNFPPFSVGECGRIGTGRREIGHGKLAWRAINSSLPLKENFPYTLRVVSEITESNGSSSMATVCGTFFNGCWSTYQRTGSWDSNGINKRR